MNANDVVTKLWRLCAILRKDGITYQQYVTELTYLLFLKMIHELDREEDRRGKKRSFSIPIGYRWKDLMRASGAARLKLYQETLSVLGDSDSRVNAHGKLVREPRSHNASSAGKRGHDAAAPLPPIVQAIFANSATSLREPTNLTELLDQIDKLHWFSTERDQFGDLYEGLLQKNAEETKRGAGQYFTPRPLIEVIVRLMKPQLNEVIQDPAAGTGGFLICADRHLREQINGYHKRNSNKNRHFQQFHAYHGMENVAGTYRLLLMNLYLHGIEPEHIDLGDTLSSKGANLVPADLIMTNPPFGPAGGRPTRNDLTITKSVSSYQLPFVEHCIRKLKVGGRAAIIVPDNVLFENGRGLELRRTMMRHCNLHTILRLPTGIFYAQGVKTNVIFLQKIVQDERITEEDKTKEVWVYDLRSAMPQFGKTNPLDSSVLEDFARVYGEDPNGRSTRNENGREGRFRRFTRDEIATRGDTLDVTWFRDADGALEDELTEPEDIAAAIFRHLEKAVAEIQALQSELAIKEGNQ